MTTGKQGAGQGVRAIYHYDLPTERLIVCPEVAPSVVAEVFMVYRTRDAWEAFDRGGAEVLPWSTDDRPWMRWLCERNEEILKHLDMMSMGEPQPISDRAWAQIRVERYKHDHLSA